jgi:hypothetical protein
MATKALKIKIVKITQGSTQAGIPCSSLVSSK